MSVVLKRSRASVAMALLTLFFAASGQANVSLKNGNFFIGYKDIIYPGGFEPKIERVYNSKTPFRGIFGFGWGTEYEVNITIAADGSVIVHEYGGGAENRFQKRDYSKGDVDQGIKQLLAAAQKLGKLSSQKNAQEYEKKLRDDVNFRDQEWQAYVDAGKLRPAQVKTGTKMYSNRFSYQYIVRLANGYQRVFDNGRAETFDEKGRLIQISDRNNNFIKFAYGKDGKVQKLEDNSFRKMYFTFNSQGFVDRVEGDGKKIARYKYNNLGELVNSVDSGGNAYNYKYSSDGRHNLTEIYSVNEKRAMKIEYYGKEMNENVKSVTERDGMRTDYSYALDKRDPGHFTVVAVSRDAKGKQLSKGSYEYFMKNKKNGEEWNSRMITDIDGERTETTYSESAGLPLVIKQGKEETQFAYDEKGRVTRKDNPIELVKLKYDDKAGKVARVERTSKITKIARWSEFKYDDRGNLLFARNSDKKAVKLFYDRNGRIGKMVDQSKREIGFKYNENSKPIEITDPRLGTIRVTYTNTGEVKNVESSAGRKIALQVTSAFQNLLDIIRPAGVTLSF